MSIMQAVRPVVDDLDDQLADIGDRIRAERKARGLSEAALAARVGLSRDTVRRVQEGLSSLRTLLQVCAALGVDVSYVLSSRWVMPEESSVSRQKVRQQPVTGGFGGSGELWTVSQVAEFLGYTGATATKTARSTLHRLGVQAVGREPGKRGQSLYRADQVKAAQATRPRARSAGGRVAFQGRRPVTQIGTS